MTYYQKAIAPKLPEGIDPRWIEAYMRVAHDTLGNLSKAQFNREIKIGIACVMEGGKDEAEKIARSFGL